MAKKHYTIKLTKAEMDALLWVWGEGWTCGFALAYENEHCPKEMAAARRTETKLYRSELKYDNKTHRLAYGLTITGWKNKAVCTLSRLATANAEIEDLKAEIKDLKTSRDHWRGKAYLWRQ